MFEQFQSCLRIYDHTEPALVRLANNIFMVSDSGLVLVPIELSAASNIVEHNILLQWLENAIGIKGTTNLQWSESCLIDSSLSMGGVFFRH